MSDNRISDYSIPVNEGWLFASLFKYASVYGMTKGLIKICIDFSQGLLISQIGCLPVQQHLHIKRRAGEFFTQINFIEHTGH
jgi:hypothetical protein